MLRRSHTLIVGGSAVDEDVKNDIAVAGRLGIAATTLEGAVSYTHLDVYKRQALEYGKL